MFWSLLGTELSCFYSSHRPYILPGDLRVEHKQTHSPHPAAPGRAAVLICCVQILPCLAVASMRPSLTEAGSGGASGNVLQVGSWTLGLPTASSALFALPNCVFSADLSE